MKKRYLLAGALAAAAGAAVAGLSRKDSAAELKIKVADGKKNLKSDKGIPSECHGCVGDREDCPFYEQKILQYRLSVQKEIENNDPRWRRYYARIGDTTISFDYRPGFERIFPEALPYDALKEVYFGNDKSGDLIHIKVGKSSSFPVEDLMNAFICSNEADDCQVITDRITDDGSGKYSGFCFWAGKDPSEHDPERKTYYRAGCNIFDEAGEIRITCIGDYMPMMFGDIEVIRKTGLCTEEMEAE